MCWLLGCGSCMASLWVFSLLVMLVMLEVLQCSSSVSSRIEILLLRCSSAFVLVGGSSNVVAVFSKWFCMCLMSRNMRSMILCVVGLVCVAID